MMGPSLPCRAATNARQLIPSGVRILTKSGSRPTLVWYPDPSVQAHARTRITACACGKEGSGEMDGQKLECENGARMQLVRIMSVR